MKEILIGLLVFPIGVTALAILVLVGAPVLCVICLYGLGYEIRSLSK